MIRIACRRARIPAERISVDNGIAEDGQYIVVVTSTKKDVLISVRLALFHSYKDYNEETTS